MSDIESMLNTIESIHDIDALHELEGEFLSDADIRQALTEHSIPITPNMCEGGFIARIDPNVELTWIERDSVIMTLYVYNSDAIDAEPCFVEQGNSKMILNAFLYASGVITE